MRLPAIEQSAGELFRTVPEMAWIADDGNLPEDAHRRYIVRGTEWVAESGSAELIGFLAAERIGRDLYIHELAVHAAYQRTGIGRQLMAKAASYAGEARLAAMTLTTFLEIPWNAPWYTRLGFTVLEADSLSEYLAQQLQAEAKRGLKKRCAMRRTLA